MPGTTACTTVLLSEPTSISWPQPYTLGGPKYTLAPDLIRCPVSVSARSSPSATLLFGVTLVSVSGSVFTTNDNVFDVRAGSPAWAGRFVTITRRPPSVASADAGTVTWIWPGVMDVGVSVSVPSVTRAFAAKPVPMISRVNALDPTLADDGESEKILRTLHGPAMMEADWLFEFVTMARQDSGSMAMPRGRLSTSARLVTSPADSVRPKTSSFSLVTSAQSRPGFTAIACGRLPTSTELISFTVLSSLSLTMCTALRFSSATTTWLTPGP